MMFDEYQNEALTTAIYREQIRGIIQRITGNDYPELATILNQTYTSLGLGETGEIQGKVKKILRDSDGVTSDESRDAISKELGDLLWYVATTASAFGLSLDDIATENLAKLASRRARGVTQGSGDTR